MTKRDYIAIARAINECDMGPICKKKIVESLIPVFKADNSNFKPQVFIDAALDTATAS